ncbi:MAG: hypothetical protein QOK37_2379 [Thermoanaerobaculia bacterium]|jgi:hypothetical protein|nr:hypothetical protein [Thermoanaerobaculia bacterium]
MADNPQDDANDKGFWDGGSAGHGTNKESSGRPNGYPGKRSNSRTGYRTDIEFPPETEGNRSQQKK